MLLGFGFFNTAEGVINLHHINETVAREIWFYWDIGYSLSGLIMLATGWLLVQGERETEGVATPLPRR